MPSSTEPHPQRPTTPPQLLALVSLLGRGAHDMELPVHGDAMAPAVPPGSLVRVRTGKAAPRAPGTVVAYVSGSGVVVERVVWRGLGPRARRFVLTRGDACLLCDPPLATESLVGAVFAHSSGDEWHPVPPPPERSRRAAVLRTALAFPIIVALEVHEGIARLVAHTMLGTGRMVAFVSRWPMHRW